MVVAETSLPSGYLLDSSRDELSSQHRRLTPDGKNDSPLKMMEIHEQKRVALYFDEVHYKGYFLQFRYLMLAHTGLSSSNMMLSCYVFVFGPTAGRQQADVYQYDSAPTHRSIQVARGPSGRLLVLQAGATGRDALRGIRVRASQHLGNTRCSQPERRRARVAEHPIRRTYLQEPIHCTDRTSRRLSPPLTIFSIASNCSFSELSTAKSSCTQTLLQFFYSPNNIFFDLYHCAIYFE